MQHSIIRQIGTSKHATVSECQTDQGRRIAVKQLDRSSASSFVLERVFSTANNWMTFAHPGLVEYQSVDTKNNQIVMDLMEQSIATRIHESYGDAKHVLAILRGLLYSLAYLHQRGLVHANVKPTNVFLDSDGRVRISDGYLYSMEAPSTLPTPTNQKYLTPEHTSDAFGGITPATDLYAAGFMALEMFAGDRFGRGFQGIGDEATDQDHAWFQWHGSNLVAPDATLFYKACPPEIAQVIARLTNKNPSDRFATAQEALSALPQNVAADTKPSVAAGAPAESAPAKRPSSANDILERPQRGIVLVIATGSRAGEMVGSDDIELAIGFEPDCLLRFSNDEYPTGQAKVTCQRTPQGWMIMRVRGDNVFVNQTQLDERMPLRSGDMVRLSPRGPDVQFNLQSPGFSVKSLISRYMPAQSATRLSPNSSAPVGPGSRPAPVPVGATRSNQPSSPSAPRPQQAPQPSRASAAPAFQAASPATPRTPVAPLPFASAPSGPAPTKSNAPIAAPAKKSAQPKAVVPNRKKEATTTAGQSGATWNPNTWSKSQKNNAILVGGLVVIGLAVLFFPTGSSSGEKPDEPKDPGGQTEKSTSNEAVTTNVDDNAASDASKSASDANATESKEPK